MKCKRWFCGFFTGKMAECLWALPILLPWAAMSQRAGLGLLQPRHYCTSVRELLRVEGKGWSKAGGPGKTGRQAQVAGWCLLLGSTARLRSMVRWYFAFYFFTLHVIVSDYWCAVHTLDYSFIDQSGSTFKVTERKRREMKTYRSTWEYGLVEWGEGRVSWWW